MKVKIKDIAFESNAEKGTALLISPENSVEYHNAIEGWNAFVSIALRPYELVLRDELEKNGYNRWTGTKNNDYTETELKMIDEQNNSRKLR